MAVTRFMNRLLALKVEVQHDVFGFFELIHHQLINEAKVRTCTRAQTGTHTGMHACALSLLLLTAYLPFTHTQVSGSYDSGVADVYAEKVLSAEQHELLRLEGAFVLAIDG